MTTTDRIAPFASRRHRAATTAGLVTAFWLAGSILVTGAARAIEPLSRRAGAVAAVAAIVLTAFAYTRRVASEAGVSHALGVGIAWLVLSLAAEMAFAAWGIEPWLALLGSPQRPLLRHALLFAWVFAPALFARRDAREGAGDERREEHV